MDLREEKPRKDRPTSFRDLRTSRLLCAVQINDNEIMGNPFLTTEGEGWHVKVAMEPGTLGVPSIGLEFHVGKKDAKAREYLNSFDVTWEPGFKIGGRWMIEDLAMMPATAPPEKRYERVAYPPAIRELFEKSGKKSDLLTRNLVFAMFRSNVHRVSELNREWFNYLEEDVRRAPLANLDTMFGGGEPSYNVKMWFVNRNVELTAFDNNTLGPLVKAVTDHTPPLHQYLDDDDQPFINYHLPTIDAIGNGMYRKYPKYTDADGRKVENTSVPPIYQSQPQSLRWDSIKTFHVTSGVPVVRTMQYNDGLHARIKRDWHHVFLQMPEFKLGDKGLDPNKAWKYTYRAGIRLTRDPKTGLKDAIPPVNSKVEIDFRNYKGEQREHKREKDELCFGYVSSLGGKDWLEKTKTDFCVGKTKPRKLKTPKKFIDTVEKTDDRLPQAKIEVVVNHEASIREKKALAKFCEERYMPGLLNPVRLAFWSEPSQSPQHIDLTKGPAHDRSDAKGEMYKRLIKELKEKRPMNKSQLRVLNAAYDMKSRIVTVQGPPGAGKTTTLRDKVIALAKIGHKVLVVASSNSAVDTDADAVWQGLDGEERKTIKCLRLESDGAEKAQRLSRRDYGQYTGEEGEQDKMPEYRGPKEAVDDPAIRNALDKLCLDFEINRAHATKALAGYENVTETLKDTERYDEIKRSNVPVGLTFDHHAWDVMQADEKEANRRFKEAQASILKRNSRGRFVMMRFS